MDTAIIGDTAGRIWKLLSEKGPHSPTAISKVLGLKTTEVERGIGWLAREGKLSFQQSKTGGITLALKDGL